MRKARLPLVAALAAATPALAQAQDTPDEDIIKLDDITISANTTETAVERSGSTVEVATQEDIRRSGEQTVAGFLNTLPGISVTSNGGLGTTTSVRVRGSSGRYLGVYVDGIDVNDPSAPQISFDFGSLLADDVSRIEVLKGAQSARYGSEAIAGVINITTNRATEPGTFHSFGAEYGSYNTSRLSYNLSHRGERGGVALTLTNVETDGFSAADENAGNTEADGHDTQRVSFATDYELTDTVTVGLNGFWQDSKTSYDEYIWPVGPADGVTPDETSESTSYGWRAFMNIVSGAVEHELAITGFKNDRVSYGTNAWGPFNYPYIGERLTGSYNGTAFVNEALTLGFGADTSDESYESGPNQGSHIMRGIYAEANWAPTDELDVAATVRHDDHSVFGGETTGRLAVAYRPVPDWILRFAAGTGFRTPSLFELFDPVNGNPALQPETSDNIEAGVEKLFANGGFARATLFQTRITDLIQWQGGSYVQVPGTARSKGIELSGGVPLSDRVILSGNATFIDATLSSGARLSRVPETDISVRLDADITDDFQLGVSLQRVANMIDGGARLPDYTLANVNASYQVTDAAQVYVRVENLFDEEYQTVRGYGTSDRAFFVGVRASF